MKEVLEMLAYCKANVYINIYVDDGYSGTNFERMIADTEAGEAKRLKGMSGQRAATQIPYGYLKAEVPQR